MSTFFFFSFLVFICDTGKECYVWIGRGASDAENKNAIPYAHVSPVLKSHSYWQLFRCWLC